MKKQINLLILIFFIFFNFVNAQNTFNKVYLLDEGSVYLSSIVATDTCYYTIGVLSPTFNALKSGNLFLKLDLNGEVEIKKVIIDSVYANIETSRNTLTPLNDGNFAVSGITIDSFWNSTLIKYSPSGDTLFFHKFQNGYHPDLFINCVDLDVFPNGDFLLLNILKKEFNSNDHESELIRVDSFGNILWRNTYGTSPLNDVLMSIKILNNENIIVGGYRGNIAQVDNGFTSINWVFETNESGEIIWQYFHYSVEELFTNLSHILPTEDNGYLFATRKATEQPINSTASITRSEMHLFKLNENHQLEWDYTIKDEEKGRIDQMEKIIPAIDGDGYVAMGHYFDYTGDILGAHKGWIGKFSPEGDSLWGRFLTYKPEGTDSIGRTNFLYDIAATPDSGYVMVGWTLVHDTTVVWPPNKVDQHGWIIKVDQHGCLVPGCHLETNITEIDNIEFELKLFPNPTSDFLNVFFRNHNRQNDFQFQIRDVSGKLIQNFKNAFSEETLMIPVWNYSKGTYFLSILNENKILKTEKFIVH